MGNRQPPRVRCRRSGRRASPPCPPCFSSDVHLLPLRPDPGSPTPTRRARVLHVLYGAVQLHPGDRVNAPVGSVAEAPPVTEAPSSVAGSNGSPGRTKVADL